MVLMGGQRAQAKPRFLPHRGRLKASNAPKSSRMKQLLALSAIGTDRTGMVHDLTPQQQLQAVQVARQ